MGVADWHVDHSDWAQGTGSGRDFFYTAAGGGMKRASLQDSLMVVEKGGGCEALKGQQRSAKGLNESCTVFCISKSQL